jgi:hypothetical protein
MLKKFGDSSSSKEDLVVISFEHDNEPSGFIKDKEISD